MSPHEMQQQIDSNTELMAAQADNLRNTWAQRNWLLKWMQDAREVMQLFCSIRSTGTIAEGWQKRALELLDRPFDLKPGLDLLEMATDFSLLQRRDAEGTITFEVQLTKCADHWIILCIEHAPTPEAPFAYRSLFVGEDGRFNESTAKHFCTPEAALAWFQAHPSEFGLDPQPAPNKV